MYLNPLALLSKVVFFMPVIYATFKSQNFYLCAQSQTDSLLETIPEIISGFDLLPLIHHQLFFSSEFFPMTFKHSPIFGKAELCYSNPLFILLSPLPHLPFLFSMYVNIKYKK